jgi:hypothetical protein
MDLAEFTAGQPQQPRLAAELLEAMWRTGWPQSLAGVG